MFTLELSRRLSGTGVIAACLNPGYNTTGLGRELRFAAALEGLLRAMRVGDPRRGADLIVRTATASDVTAGGYYSGKTARTVAPVAPADDPDRRRDLWEATAELLDVKGHRDVYEW
jgi:NAD(P)-dependent dehydrogenase (short-subunit alcohol dehydrogenase family)